MRTIDILQKSLEKAKQKGYESPFDFAYENEKYKTKQGSQNI